MIRPALRNRPDDRRSQLLLLTLAVAIVGFTQIVRYSYPINVGAFDYPNYVRMIADGTSNLVHASGYPALVHFILEQLGVTYTPPVMMDLDWLDTVQQIQNVVHLALFGASLWLCATLFGRRAMVLAVIGWGMNVLFLGNVNAAAPEWLQGDLILLSLLLGAYAGTRRRLPQLTMHVVAAGVFAGAYLVKYNAVLLAPAFLALIVFNGSGWRRIAVQVAASAATFLAIVSLYITSYHYPSTGTRTLSFDHTWVLTAGMPPGYFARSPETLGEHALRYVVLCSVTPPAYDRAEAYSTIDWGAPADVRLDYASRYDDVMRAPREELLALARTHPRPNGFTNFTSSIPIYYYYGLERTDRLGPALYLEALTTMPGYYASRIANGLWHHFTVSPSSPVLPTYSEPLGSTLITSSSSNVVSVTPAESLASPFFARYYNPRLEVRAFGMTLVDRISALASFQAVYIAINVLSLVGLFALTAGIERTSGWIFAAALVLFVTGSVMLVGLRNKEVVAITPLYFVTCGLAAGRAWDAGMRFVRGRRGARQVTGAPGPR